MNKTSSNVDLSNQSQCAHEIKVRIADNGEWEYLRIGLGKDSKGVFLVDLDDDGQNLKPKTYVKEGLDIDDLVRLGLKHEVFEDWSFNGRKDIRYRMDDDLQGEWDDYLHEILTSKDFDTYLDGKLFKF